MLLRTNNLFRLLSKWVIPLFLVLMLKLLGYLSSSGHKLSKCIRIIQIVLQLLLSLFKILELCHRKVIQCNLWENKLALEQLDGLEFGLWLLEPITAHQFLL